MKLCDALHMHRREDESFLIIDGEATLFVGDQVIETKPGSFVFLPQGIPPAFRIDSGTAQLFNLITPAGFENFYLDLREPARELVMPPALEGPPTFKQ
jgi:quercetin dioxygenase-like cupin family protein